MIWSHPTRPRRPSERVYPKIRIEPKKSCISIYLRFFAEPNEPKGPQVRCAHYPASKPSVARHALFNFLSLPISIIYRSENRSPSHPAANLESERCTPHPKPRRRALPEHSRDRRSLHHKIPSLPAMPSPKRTYPHTTYAPSSRRFASQNPTVDPRFPRWDYNQANGVLRAGKPSAYLTRNDRHSAFRSRGTPVAPDPQSSRQAQRPGCRPLPRPGGGAGRCRRAIRPSAPSCSPPTARPSAPAWTWPRSSAGADTAEINAAPRAALHRGRAARQAADRRRSTARRWPAAPGWWPTANRGGRADATLASPKSAWGSGLSWSIAPWRPPWASGARWNFRSPGRIFDAGRKRADLGLVHEVAADASARALRNRPGSRRIQPDRHPEGDGVRPTGTAGWIGTRPARSPERYGIRYLAARTSRKGFVPSGRSGSPMAVDRGRCLKFVPLDICGYATLDLVVSSVKDTQCWGGGALLLRCSAFSIVTTPPSQARLKLC